MTSSQNFNDLKQMLNKEGIDSSSLKDELHYDLPDHPLIHEAEYNAGDLLSMRELIAQRHNADLALHKVIEGFPGAEPVRIWPHHFDTGKP